ncbi:AraC family transcriptional regulator [Streptomyces sp. CBMA291]|nr:MULTISPECIES: helix-turn-helix domain-containing protein [unclassified Streptomyces]MBD0709960.1 AraC family transcriptional regulator [Streptomyces sp. CBMA291]MBD0712889.1 AraC family transcriptional regulator [Streptomyces sp. CBMA370]MBD0717115.1 AraC family transcriptional regulator [Streptomyces sp. CBMA370]
MSSGGLPDRERFDWFADLISREVMPTALTSERPAEFGADLALLDLGGLQVSKVAYSPLRSRRTPALIRRGDPEQYQLGLVTGGSMLLDQNGAGCEAEAGDLVFWDTSRPSDARYVSDGDGGTGQLVILQLPRDALPLPADRLDGLLAHRVPGRSGTGAVLADFLRSLVTHGGACTPEELARLGAAAVDLAAACLARSADAEDLLPAEARSRELLRRVRLFIEYNLGDPKLTPAVVAARHNLSVRSLHQLFKGGGETVQARIRRRRLERCRDDLADPALLAHPVQAIAARRGFSGPAVFSRAFREAYGISPTEYRALTARAGGAQAP